MTKHVYDAVIREDRDGGYWAEVPDLPECFGQGDNFMAAVESISDGVETHLAALESDGADIPPPAGTVTAADGTVVYVYADPDTFQIELMEESVSAAEAARMLGVSASRVSQLIASSWFIAVRTAKGMRVAMRSIEALNASPRSDSRPKKAVTA